MNTHLRNLALLLGIFSLITLALSCEDEAPLEIDTETETEIDTVYTLNLLNPVETTVPSYCCVDFEWNSNARQPARLQLSSSDTFQDLILDTILETNSFSFTAPLPPHTTFFWAVQLQDSLYARSSFSTEDILTAYLGSYQVEIVEWCWRAGAPSLYCDTMYLAPISIEQTANRLLLTDDNSQFDGTYAFDRYLSPDQPVYVRLDDSPYNYTEVLLDLQTDSIFGSYQQSTQVSTDRFSFRGRME